MTVGKRVSRGGRTGHIVHVAPREGYDRFVPDRYEPTRAKRGRRQ